MALNTIELKNLEERIAIFSKVLSCLQVRMFYLRNKSFADEYSENENELKMIRTESDISKTKAQLMFLRREHEAHFEIYKAIIDEQRTDNSNSTSNA